MKIGILGVASSAGGRAVGLENCPTSLRKAGLINKLVEGGNEVADYGDTEVFIYSPDPRNPKSRNKNLVVKVCRLVAKKVEQIVRDGFHPLVLGGDCTIAIGSMAGIVNVFPSAGLIYLDDDTDLNTPATSPSGIFDGMVVSHIIGQGLNELSHLARRYPIAREEDVVLFGFDPFSGFVDPPEIEFLKSSPIAQFSLGEIRKAGVESSARVALQGLEAQVDKIFLHFDVDFIGSRELPAKDLVHPDGLTFDEAEKALKIFSGDEHFLGIEITEFNPTKDPDCHSTDRIVELLTQVLKKKDSKQPKT
jgi:arginase